MGGRFVKTINALSAGFSYLKGFVAEDVDPSEMPSSLSVELSAFCNLSCRECPSGSESLSRQRGFMDPLLYKKIIQEAGPWLFRLNLYFQGEPMMHPAFFSFLEKNGSYRLVVSTNGHFLDAGNSEKLARSCLDELTVSLDGMDQATYSDYRRGGDFDRVIGGIRGTAEAIKQSNSKLKLVLQYLVTRLSEGQIPQAEKLAAETGAVLRLKSMQVYDMASVSYWMPSKSRFRRYSEEGERYVVKSRLPNNCARMWFNPVVTWDGLVVPCCFDKDAGYVMGDLKQNSLREIWNGDEYRKFRKAVLTGRKKLEMCRNCTSGLERGIVC